MCNLILSTYPSHATALPQEHHHMINLPHPKINDSPQSQSCKVPSSFYQCNDSIKNPHILIPDGTQVCKNHLDLVISSIWFMVSRLIDWNLINNWDCLDENDLIKVISFLHIMNTTQGQVISMDRSLEWHGLQCKTLWH